MGTGVVCPYPHLAGLGATTPAVCWHGSRNHPERYTPEPAGDTRSFMIMGNQWFRHARWSAKRGGVARR